MCALEEVCGPDSELGVGVGGLLAELLDGLEHRHVVGQHVVVDGELQTVVVALADADGSLKTTTRAAR